MGPPAGLQASGRRRGRARCLLEPFARVRWGAGAARASCPSLEPLIEPVQTHRARICKNESEHYENTMNNLPEKTATVYAGLDIAKATLQLHCQNQPAALPNNAQGHAELVKRLQAVPGAHLVCEATGGYERALVAALQTANLPVSVVNPAQVRHFALAQGRRAKNDPLDAAVLAAYGQAIQPAPTPVPEPVLAQLRALVQWRDQLKEQLARLRMQTEHLTLRFAQQQQAKLITHLKKQMDCVEAELERVLALAPKIQAQVQALVALAGVGQITALGVLTQMPELGRLNRRQTAALAGLAPWTRQSGPWEGQRHIGGGRAVIRQALYMSAVVLARQKQTALGKFYARLRLAGKPAKVALTAVMRKLLLQMNQTLKDHALKTA
jgi:transposase